MDRISGEGTPEETIFEETEKILGTITGLTVVEVGIWIHSLKKFRRNDRGSSTSYQDQEHVEIETRLDASDVENMITLPKTVQT